MINAGSGVGTTVARVAAILAESGSGTTSVRFSGIVRPATHSSLLADDAMLRTCPLTGKSRLSRALRTMLGGSRIRSGDRVCRFASRLRISPDGFGLAATTTKAICLRR